MEKKALTGKVTKYYSHYVNRDRCFWLFCVSLFTLLLFMIIPPIMGSAFRDLKVGDEIKPFTLKDLDGKDVNIWEYKGKILVLNFFDVEKEKSQKALIDLEKIKKEFKGKDVVIVSVTANKEKIEDLKKFKDENNISFPILMDEEKEVYKSFGIFVMPVTAIINKEFKIVYEYSSHLLGYDSEVGGRIKVELGEVSLEDYKKTIEKTVIKQRSGEEKSAIKKLGQAEMLLIRGRPDEALKLLEEVVELDPKSAKAHLLLGDALLKKGKLDEAMAEYDKVKSMVKKNSPLAKTASVGVGAIHALRGDLDRAKKVLSMAAMINPNPITSAKAYYWLGFIDEKKGNLKGAVKNYKKAVEKLLAKAQRSR